MSSIIKEITEHVLFKPMYYYLSFSKIKPDKFFEMLYNKDECIENVMNPLYHFGFYHIIIPLNELLSVYLDENTLAWWQSTENNMENHLEISTIQISFHQKIDEYIVKNHFNEIPHTLPFFTSFSEMERLLWESYPKNIYSISNTKDEALAIGIPGLYQTNLSKSLLVYLEQSAFPKLISLSKQYNNSIVGNDRFILTSLKLCVYFYCSELGWRYYYLFSSSLSNVLEYDEQAIANMRYKEYRNLLFGDSVLSPITTSWVEQLKCLVQLYEKYLLDNYSDNKRMRCSIPILMQCVGLSDDSSEYLLNLIKQLSIREKSNDIILLALYRSVSTERDKYRSHFLSALEIIFNSNTFPIALLDTLEDILNFYQEYSDELPKRFNKDYLTSIIKNAEEDDKFYYNKFLLFLEYGKIGNIDNIKWISDCIFSNKKVVSYMEELLNQIKNPEEDYKSKLLNIYLFDAFFHSLISHISCNVRINVESAFSYLNIDTKREKLVTREVFEIYSHKQINLLLELIDRLNYALEYIPSYNTVIKYESIRFDATEKNQQLIERIENILLLYKNQIDQLRLEHLQLKIVFDYLIKYIVNDNNQLSQIVMEAFVNDRELTKDFCEAINEICKKSEQQGTAYKNIDSLKRLRDFIEKAISNPEAYQNQIIKEDLFSALDNIIDCIPLVSNVANVINAFKSLKNALEKYKERFDY